MRRPTVLPQPPDGTHEVAFKGADSLALGLVLTQAARHVVMSRGPTAQLGQGDAVEDGVEPPVAPTVETVADSPGRGGLQERNAGIGRDLGVAAEAPAPGGRRARPR